MTNLYALSNKRDLNKNSYILLDKEKLELSDEFEVFMNKNTVKNSIV